MIKIEQIDEHYIRQYSDKNVWIRQVETGHLYEEAVDRLPCRYTYEETDQPIIRESVEKPEENEEEIKPIEKEEE